MVQKMLTPEELALLFHETYERLAPRYGYVTKASTKIFDNQTPNGKLMIAVCKTILFELKAYGLEAYLERELIKKKYGLTKKDWWYGTDIE